MTNALASSPEIKEKPSADWATDKSTLLIADDHASMRSLIRQVCGERNHQFIEAATGKAAHTAFTEHLPDLVIMDIEMPELDGISATKNILTENPTALIIIVTQSDGSEIRQAATEAGARAFLSKDQLIDLPQLINTLLS